jgi:hypothetical protein
LEKIQGWLWKKPISYPAFWRRAHMAFPPSSSSHCTMVNRMLWASERSGMEKSEEQFFRVE